MSANETQTGETIISTTGDASWVIRNAFLVLTMQSGFSLLEAGFVSSRNTSNIMVKNIIDVVFGGVIYWAVGFGLSFGTPCNVFCCYGDFFLSPDETHPEMGSLYVLYFFQFSFASTATTIFSGSVAERIRMDAYIIFTCINVLIYVLPSYWSWGSHGFLKRLGFHDFAGACVVHMSGGICALVGAVVIGPRKNRYSGEGNWGLQSPVTAITGTLLLWWAWFGFNCGSTFGLKGNLWKVAGKVAVTTMNGSIGGVMAGMGLDMIIYRRDRKVSIPHLLTSILGGLVAVTGGCAVITPMEALLVGAIGAWLAIGSEYLLEFMKIDDPVSAIPVHLVAGAWGTLAVGIFGSREFGILSQPGLIRGGGTYLLGVQTLGLVVITGWNGLLTLISLFALKSTIGLRSSEAAEEVGGDWVYHHIGNGPQAKKFKSNVFAALKATRKTVPESVVPMKSAAPVTVPTQEEEKKVENLMKSLLKDGQFRRIVAEHLQEHDKVTPLESLGTGPVDEISNFSMMVAGLPFDESAVNAEPLFRQSALFPLPLNHIESDPNALDTENS